VDLYDFANDTGKPILFTVLLGCDARSNELASTIAGQHAGTAPVGVLERRATLRRPLSIGRRALRVCHPPAGEAEMLEPGTPAPDFTAKNHRGETVRSADHRGRYVVLWFYPMADTPG